MNNRYNHIDHNRFDEQEVILKWEDNWYRLPFYLLEDVRDGFYRKGEMIIGKELNLWLQKHKNSDVYMDMDEHESAIEQLKTILKDEMKYMVAYKYEEELT